MYVKNSIRKLRLIALLLFIAPTIGLLGSLIIHNYLVSFNFTHGKNVSYYLSETPGETRDLHLDCNLENNYCQSDEVKIIHLNKINTSLRR